MSEIKKLVQETYRATIRIGDYPPDLKKFLTEHERRLVFFDNLCKEFDSPKLAKKLTRESVVSTTQNLTHLFVLAAKRRADDLRMSDIERAMIKHKQDRKKEMAALADAMDSQGEEYVTQDQAGNETSKSQVIIEERFV